MEELFLPTLHTFEMENIYTGSLGLFRFRIVPSVVKSTPKEVDLAASSMTAEFWHGLFCYEKSEMEGKQTFPMSPEGLEEMRAWLLSNR